MYYQPNYCPYCDPPRCPCCGRPLYGYQGQQWPSPWTPYPWYPSGPWIVCSTSSDGGALSQQNTCQCGQNTGPDDAKTPGL